MTEINAMDAVANELHDIWLRCLNIYPLKVREIKSRIDVLINGQRKSNKFKLPAKHGFRQLRSLANNPSDKVQEQIKEFNSHAATGFDIRTFSLDRIDEIESMKNEVGLPLIAKMTEEEENFWRDNVKIKTCQCLWTAINKCPECPRQIVNGNDTDKKYKAYLIRQLQEINQAKSLLAKNEADKERKEG